MTNPTIISANCVHPIPLTRQKINPPIHPKRSTMIPHNIPSVRKAITTNQIQPIKYKMLPKLRIIPMFPSCIIKFETRAENAQKRLKTREFNPVNSKVFYCAIWTSYKQWTQRLACIKSPIIVLLGCGRSANHLDYLFCDRRLPYPVHIECQGIDKLAGVFRCRIHSRHARTLLGGNRFDHAAVYLRLDLFGEQFSEDLCRRLLIYILGLRS